MRENTENTLHILIHELKNPLTVIKGYSELIKTAKGTEKNEFAEIISRETDYAAYLLNNISTLNKLEENIPMVIDTENICIREETERIIRIYKDRYSHIEWINKTDENTLCQCDRNLFRIMFFNIIENSAKYTERGQVTISSEKDEKGIYIITEDNGCGIEKEKIPYLTQLYYRATDKYPGTGIGLYLVNKICEKTDTLLKIESRTGKGTSVTLFFPYK